jgi:hypothetical protein
MGLFVLVLVALLAVNPPRGSRGRGLISFAFFVPGLAFLCLAAYDMHATSKSINVTIQGPISSLEKFTGKASHTSFHINSNRDPLELTTNYSGYRLRQGELVRATYLLRSGKVSDLTILSGENAGWNLHEDRDRVPEPDLLLLLFGGFCFYLTYISLTQKNKEEPTHS